MNINKIGPCNNCGGDSYTNPSKVGLPTVTVDEAKNVNVDVSQVLVVDVIVCNDCGNVKTFHNK